MEEKVFVVFNTTSIGDVLVTNTLIQNIKYYYPDSKVVFVCNDALRDITKYQDGVDDVITYDKNKIKNLIQIFKFTSTFPYKKPFASFVTYSNERNLLISRLIGAKHIISHHKFKFWNTKEKYPLKEYVHIKDRWGGMIEPLTGEHKNLPIKYNLPEADTPVIQEFRQLKNPVIISPTSNFKPKDMSASDCDVVIGLLNDNGYTPVITGAGQISRDFSEQLRKICKTNYTDFTDKTSFIELANILKLSKGCISVDTGTLHFANSLQVPTVGIFYHNFSEVWGSDCSLYPAIILNNNTSPSDIMNAFKELQSRMVCVS